MKKLNLAGVSDLNNCEQAKAIREWQKDQYRLFPKIKLWKKIKFLFKRHEHKWELSKDEKRGFTETHLGIAVGEHTLWSKAFKCKDCGVFKFWYSHDMGSNVNLQKQKERFEFNVVNELEAR